MANAGNILQGIGQALSGSSNALINAEELKQRSLEFKEKAKAAKMANAMGWVDRTSKLPKELRKDAFNSSKGREMLATTLDMSVDQITDNHVKTFSKDTIAELTTKLLPLAIQARQSDDPTYNKMIDTALKTYQEADQSDIYTAAMGAINYAETLRKKDDPFDKEFDYNYKDAQNIKNNAITKMGEIRKAIKNYAGDTQEQALLKAATEQGYTRQQLRILNQMEMTKIGSKEGTRRMFDLDSSLGSLQFTKQTEPQGNVSPESVKNIAGSTAQPTSEPTVALPNKEKFQQEETLRKELQKPVQEHQDVIMSYRTMKDSAKLKTGAGDVGMIYSFFKMKDRGGRVTDNEYQTGKGMNSVIQKFGNEITAVYSSKGKKLLSDQARQAILEASKADYSASQQKYDQNYSRYKKMAGNYGLDLDNIIEGLQLAPAELQPIGQEGVSLDKNEQGIADKYGR